MEDDVWIGMNSLILSGVKIGKGAVIGAGAVVAKDIPPYAIAIGNPCKIVKYRFDREIQEKLKNIEYVNYTFKNEDILYQEVTKENLEKILEKLELDRCK